MNKIENAYGTLFLSEERAREYMEIVCKHMQELGTDLKKHNLCPVCLSIGRTTVYELDYINQLNKE